MKCIKCGRNIGESNQDTNKNVCDLCKGFKVFTPKELKKIANTINERRLDTNYCEVISLSCLYQREYGCYGENEKDMIKQSILFAYSLPDKYLTEKDKQRIKKLKDNEEVVDIVLDTIHQWFGSSVGCCYIENVAKRVRRAKSKHDMLNQKQRDEYFKNKNGK